MKIDFRKFKKLFDDEELIKESAKDDVFGYISDVDWDDYIPEISSDNSIWWQD